VLLPIHCLHPQLGDLEVEQMARQTLIHVALRAVVERHHLSLAVPKRLV
jgi:hypothetical protein